MKRFLTYGFAGILLTCLIMSCEKEININVPPSKEQLVVEASITQLSPSLNYVYLTHSIDYFKPDLTIGGISDATVTITEGVVSGNDTFYNGTSYTLMNINDVNQFPGADTLFADYGDIVHSLAGVYMNPALVGRVNTPYRLDIILKDGRTITGVTAIPQVVPIDTITYELRGEPDDSGRKAAYVSIAFFDPPGHTNYRMAVKNSYFGNILLGWGAADFYRTFDDELVDNQKRVYPFARSFKQTDTLNFYLSTIGRKEYLFWESFGQASNSGNPFSAPVSLKSNVTGAIGSFTGYGCSFRQIILK